MTTNETTAKPTKQKSKPTNQGRKNTEEKKAEAHQQREGEDADLQLTTDRPRTKL